MAATAPQKYSWRFSTAAPPREVFANMEQMIGTFPYRFEVVGHDEARIVEFERNGFMGNWVAAKRSRKWVTCRAVESESGTEVSLEASKGKAAMMRGLQMVELFSKGLHDKRTIYRSRDIPPGPVTLVASWAGTPYQLFTEPSFGAGRSTEIRTATHVDAIPGGGGAFLKVRLADGTEGYVERDQVVPAPERATRQAQEETANRV